MACFPMEKFQALITVRCGMLAKGLPSVLSDLVDLVTDFVTGASGKKSKHSDLSPHGLSINMDIWFLTLFPVALRPYPVRLV